MRAIGPPFCYFTGFSPLIDYLFCLWFAAAVEYLNGCDTWFDKGIATLQSYSGSGKNKNTNKNTYQDFKFHDRLTDWIN